MKGFGAFLIITLGAVYSISAGAQQSCGGLFRAYGSETVQKIDRKISKPFAKHYAVLTPELNLSLVAKSLGLELINTRSFFGTHHSDTQLKEKEFSSKEILELGDSLMGTARKFAIAAKLNFTLRRIDIKGSSRNVMVISTEGTHPLNREVKILGKKNKVEVLYNPYDVVAMNAEAMYTNNQILISEYILVNGSIYKDAVGRHELVHMRIKELKDEKIPYLLHGEALATKGRLPGKTGPYDKYLGFEEMDAYFVSSQAKMETFINYKAEGKQFSDARDKAIWDATNNTYLKAHLMNGHLVSVRSLEIFTRSLKLLENNVSKLNIIKEDGYYIAKWYVTFENGVQYLVEIPFLPTKDSMSRVEVEELLISHLQQKQYAATYYRNIFKVGMDLFERIEKTSDAEKSNELKKYKKIFLRKSEFNSYNEIPTQKMLLESLK